MTASVEASIKRSEEAASDYKAQLRDYLSNVGMADDQIAQVNVLVNQISFWMSARDTWILYQRIQEKMGHD